MAGEEPGFEDQANPTLALITLIKAPNIRY
ncbi:Uncharacterised protein [Vibrio anguillarum]|nr:Uncharacterised protein [Vibrio anguillarum]